MGEKSAQKKQYILNTARSVFVEKGFKNVTMKDIVEACEISRGGLYLYFDSTEHILMEILQMEAQETDDVFTDHISEEDTAADILTLFLAVPLIRRVKRQVRAAHEAQDRAPLAV